uniref:Uncharacterized protein n=1 Tax=Romanomermis culicivorax TaxID=13658 RepID=A0A915IE77_ROMCU
MAAGSSTTNNGGQRVFGLQIIKTDSKITDDNLQPNRAERKFAFRLVTFPRLHSVPEKASIKEPFKVDFWGHGLLAEGALGFHETLSAVLWPLPTYSKVRTRKLYPAFKIASHFSIARKN